MNMQKIKSGFLTSEFWVTVATFLVNIFVLTGTLTPNEADEFVKAVATAFTAISTIIVTVVYIYARMRIKTATSQISTQGQSLPTATPVDTVDPSGLSSNSLPQYIVQ